jgi:hypothetical protein
MRARIELTDDQRVRHLALSARRRSLGYSVLIGEALNHYLEETVDGRQTEAGGAGDQEDPRRAVGGRGRAFAATH